MSLRYAILVVVNREERSGYEIANIMDISIGNVWNASHQQIYKELSRLAEEKLVRYKKVHQSNKPSKKVYTITKKGRQDLIKWLETPVGIAPRKDPFMIKIFAGYLTEPEILLQELKRHQEIFAGIVENYKNLEQEVFKNPEKLSLDMQYFYMALKNGIILRKAWLKWSKEMENFLENQISNQANI